MSTLLVLGTLLLTVRTAVSFITGSAIVYFAQPMATAVVISIVLIASAALGRPFTQRFAHDFCPIDPELLARPLVRRFFIRISLLWATVLLLNAGIVLWLLLSSSLHAFVLERSAVTYGLTALAIYPLGHPLRGYDAPGWHHGRVEPALTVAHSLTGLEGTRSEGAVRDNITTPAAITTNDTAATAI